MLLNDYTGVSMTSLSHIRTLTASDINLANCGGKGNAMAELARAGFPVPPGFCVTVGAYSAFTQAHGIATFIQQLLSKTAIEDLTQLHDAAQQIQAQFAAHAHNAAFTVQLRDAYMDLGGGPVAVRSSATAEDLPDQSFAGQHDSYLNISGFDALAEHIKRCWASLWNAHAISYRHQAGIGQQDIAMAVIVQRMIPADVSGVLFTTDPQGLNAQNMVLDATAGLGDALVGGETEADHYIISRTQHEVQEHKPGNTTSPTLSPNQVKALAAVGQQVEEEFEGTPQDIEWAIADDTVWVLQSRPITTLAEHRLSWEAPYPGAQLIRRQVVENMPAPLSPLFETLYLGRALDQAMDNMLEIMGLPVDIDEYVTRPLFITVNGYGYCRYDFHANWGVLRQLPRIISWYVRRLPGWLKTLVPNWQTQGLPGYLQQIETWRQQDPGRLNDQSLWQGIQALTQADAEYWFQITLVMGVAKVSEGALAGFLRSRLMRRAAADTHAGELLRGFDSPTLAAQKNLAGLAAQVQLHHELAQLVSNSRAADLMAVLGAAKHVQGAAELLSGLERHLQQHGHLVYNLDFAEPTQAEQPTPILLALQSLVGEQAPLQSLETRQANLRQASETLRSNLRIRLGPLRRRIFNTLLGWAEGYAPHREHALHYMGAAWPVLRGLAHELGQRLANAGYLHSAADIYFLRAEEIQQWLDAADEARPEAFAQLVSERRALRQLQRRTHPPGRVPVDVRFKIGPMDITRYLETWETQKRNPSGAGRLSGFAVSPGQITGPASVIHDPADFELMQPHSILVCPTTTPAWTPLFSQATALVTDIGAPLAHGSIVAREYGIPAVLGTGNATRLVKSGQRINVDGSRGIVIIEDN